MWMIRTEVRDSDINEGGEDVEGEGSYMKEEEAGGGGRERK